MNHSARARFIILIAGIATLAAAVWLVHHFHLASFDGEALAAQVQSMGVLGPAVLVALLVLQSIISPLPSQPILIAAGFLYGPAVGFAVGWLGVAVGACACFALARALGRPFVERFAKTERLATVDAYVGARGLRTTFFTVMSLRLFAHISFDVVSYGCGLIRFPFRWFLAATALGEVPKVFAFTYLGAGLGETPGWLKVMIMAGILGALVVWLWIARRGA